MMTAAIAALGATTGISAVHPPAGKTARRPDTIRARAAKCWPAQATAAVAR
jgi:hypothetical protein